MSDAGPYTCVAQNGVGEPATKEFRLNIRGIIEYSSSTKLL